jgi:hypothetical protein
MIVAVADTHALIWAVLGDPRLSPAARVSMTVDGTDSVGVSAITLVEIVYLEEKRRLPAGICARISTALATSLRLLWGHIGISHELPLSQDQRARGAPHQIRPLIKRISEDEIGFRAEGRHLERPDSVAQQVECTEALALRFVPIEGRDPPIPDALVNRQDPLEMFEGKLELRAGSCLSIRNEVLEL